MIIGLARRTPFVVVEEMLALRSRNATQSTIGFERRIFGRNQCELASPNHG